MKKIMLKTFAIALSLLVCEGSITTTAQTQAGYVKTLGRPGKAGTALSGVTIRARGEHNATTSGNDGRFALRLTGKKPGDAYALQQVQKKGYELNELAVIGRPYAFSDKVPLTIVMVSSAQLQADKLRIENNAFKVAEKNYKARLALIEKQRDKGAITAENYRKQLQELQDKFEKYQSLIDGLADHYAHVDYDGLDDKEREINLCIENGELERADSLLQTVFDPTDVLQRNKAALAKLDQQEAQAQDIIAQANADMAAVLKQQDKDAEYLYHLYTIALSRFDNEKARYYIETRAELDTMNVEWQNQAGQFIRKYIADYAKALSITNEPLGNPYFSLERNTRWTATAYNNIGFVYCSKGGYASYGVLSEGAGHLEERCLEEEHPNIATDILNIGLSTTHRKICTCNRILSEGASHLEKGVWGGTCKCRHVIQQHWLVY